jgi:hypothetical protein
LKDLHLLEINREQTLAAKYISGTQMPNLILAQARFRFVARISDARTEPTTG